MEVMLVFITEEFFDSYWTNQEIGFALGRGTPILSLAAKCAPCGFIADTQALPGDIDDPASAADGMYKILDLKKFGHGERIKKATLNAFISASSFEQAKNRFDKLKAIPSITEGDIQQIINAFAENESLYKCFHLTNRA